jgi:murein DD-endopeptidase MepM/ murein hydrolase activator NlpD
VARRQTYRRRKKAAAPASTSMWVGAVLVALTAINVYVFFFRDDTSVQKLMPRAGEVAGKGEPGRDKGRADPRKLAKAAMLPGTVPVPEPGTPPAGGGIPGNPDNAAKSAATAPAPGEAGRVVEGTIGDNDTLYGVIEREGLGPAAPAVLRALSRLYDPKSIQPGDAYAVAFNGEGAPTVFEFRPSPILRYVVARGSDGSWSGTKEEKPIEVRAEATGGTIDSSLYEAVAKAGEGPALAVQLVELFAWDINFYTDTHPGDRWRMVVEKQFLEGKFYRYGNVLAAEYSGKAGTFRAFAWSSPPGRGPIRYYDDKGLAITKSFLKTPLRFVRVSSKFDRNRFHPVLHVNKAHLGVDYAAPVGTPIWASASGRVVECGMKSGSGNTVVIDHGGGMATRYYHMSRFAPGMRAGRQVRQKEVIGYVGTTGLSTGPHLHFSLTRNGAFIDPMKMQAVREAPVPDRVAFLNGIKGYSASMASLTTGRAASPAASVAKK